MFCSNQPPYIPHLAPCDFWLFPKLKPPLKGNRLQPINAIQENTTEQLMVIGRPVWGPKMPTLKGTEASLPYVQCFLYLISSSINASIFHRKSLDTFWTDHIYIYILYIFIYIERVIYMCVMYIYGQSHINLMRNGVLLPIMIILSRLKILPFLTW